MNFVKKLLFFLTLIGAALVGVAFLISRGGATERVNFGVVPVERGLLEESISATGPIGPREVTVVFSPIGGQVVKIYDNADSNRTVEENEPLLLLDQSQAKIKLDQARAAVVAAKTDVV